MQCYNDRTYCIHPDCTCSPNLRMTKAVEAAAHAWWETIHPGHGNDAPIAIADMCQGKPQTTPADAINSVRNDLADIAAGNQPGVKSHD